MRARIVVISLSTALLAGQTQPPPQTARQALIEMFFGQSADHMEKHLPDVTRRSIAKFGSGPDQNWLSQLSVLGEQARASGAEVEIFDIGPALLTSDEKRSGSGEKTEITVERDDLVGDEDQIEVALHLSRNGKEEVLPFVPRLTLIMKMERAVWRLNEISLTVRLPLADQDFLNNLEDRQRSQNQQSAMASLNLITRAEQTYHAANNTYACTLSRFSPAANTSAPNHGYFDPEIAAGKKGGYIFAISGCDGSHFKAVAEPSVSGSGERAFCSDESGTIRAAADGKAMTCLSKGEPVAPDAHILVAPAAQ
jgi:hypothetical protein